MHVMEFRHYVVLFEVASSIYIHTNSKNSLGCWVVYVNNFH